MELKKKKEKVYSDCPTTRRRKGIEIRSKSLFPDKEGVYPTNDKQFVIRIFDTKKHIYTTVAKIKDYDVAVERLKTEQKKQKQFQKEQKKERDARWEEYRNNDYQRPEPTKNLITGFDLNTTK